MCQGRTIATVYSLSTFAVLSLMILLNSSSVFHREQYSSDTRVAIGQLLLKFEEQRARGEDAGKGNGILKGGGCRSRRNVVLLKTHKTGSSTLQNILYRYGDRNKLIFALPLYDNYFGTPLLFKDSYVLKLPNVQRYNILANHARYQKEAFRSMMPPDTVYITSLRHPAKQYESLYKYYKFTNRFHQPIEIFAQNPEKYYEEHLARRVKRKRLQAAINPMLYDLGLEKTDLRTWSKIRQKIEEIETNFGLVVISEYFDESLILLKDILCWNLEDVAYFKLNARVEDEVEHLSPEMEKNLTEWNSGDMALYIHFNETFWEKVNLYGLSEIKKEVEKLHKIIEKLKHKCLDDNSELHFPGKRTAVLRHKVKSGLDREEDYFCKSFTRTPQEYLNILRKKMRNIGNKIA